MEYIQEEQSCQATILCCQCGISIKPNPANMCVSCLRTQCDITEGIPKQGTLHFCRGCERYLQPPSEWVKCSLESRELLALCLRKLKGLNGVKLVDAGFIWTEPHSKRIKVKLTVHAEVIGKVTLEQVFIVEFTVNHQMCDDCHRSEANNFWRASVQIRQKTENKKTFYYLEQLILKHKAHEQTLGIKPIYDGLDFFFATESHARKFIDFLNAVLACKYQHSKKLLSHDVHSNIYNYKFTYSVEIVPLSKDSVVCLPKKLTQQLGGINALCLVLRVTSSIHLIDPASAQTVARNVLLIDLNAIQIEQVAEVSSTVYWRHQFNSICNPKQLIEYIVMDIEPIASDERLVFPGQGSISNRHVLADVWLVKASELGVNENTIHSRTHLGHVLKPGDSALGYVIKDSNVNDSNYEKLNQDYVPDVILVKKFYGNRSIRRRVRNWKLKHLGLDDDMNSTNNDYVDFLEDLEEDPAYRQNVNIYKDSRKPPPIPIDSDSVLDPGVPQITLEEMLDDLHIDDVDMSEVS